MWAILAIFAIVGNARSPHMLKLRSRRAALALAAVGLVVASGALTDAQEGSRGQGAEPLRSIAERTEKMKKIDGFFPIYWDELAGRIFLEVPRLDMEVLHTMGFGTGLGSNDIGIDRGALAGSRIIFFERAGPKLLMVQPNYQYRGTSGNPAEVRDVREAFARSVLWSFPITAASDNRYLVDFTDFLVRDPVDIASRLRPGTYRFEAARSSIYMPMTAAFPKNTEFEAELTFVRQPGGSGAAGGQTSDKWQRQSPSRHAGRWPRHRPARIDRRHRRDERAPLRVDG